MHPAVGMLLERVVPEGGFRLESGAFLREGTIVGASPWVVHRDARIFGEEPDRFVPERWLQKKGESRAGWDARLQRMTRATMTFGMGPRTCIGKNISLLEIYKLLPSLFLRYDVSFLPRASKHSSHRTRSSWWIRKRSGRSPILGLHVRRVLNFTSPEEWMSDLLDPRLGMSVSQPYQKELSRRENQNRNL